MFSSLDTTLKLLHLPTYLAQAIVVPETTLVFSGPKILVALLCGVSMAFAFQLLLTSLSIAVGISAIGGDSDSDNGSSQSLGSTIRGLESKVGIWALISASIALFAASYFAVKLSLIPTALLGAIIGVVIWSTYFSVIVWFGSSAVGSLLGSLVKTATSGLQGLMGTATAAMGANAAKNQMVSTAEEITAAVRRELTSGFDADSIKNSLQSSLSSLPIPSFDTKEIRSQFEKLLQNSDLQSLTDNDVLKNINRQTFIDLISSRTDFSQSDINKIADQLEGAWKQVIGAKNPTEEVLTLINSATPEELNTEKLSEQLQQIISAVPTASPGNGMMKQALRYGLGAAGTAVLNRVNIADLDVEKITTQLQKLQGKSPNIDVQKITSQLKQLASQASEKVTEKLPTTFQNTIKSDVEEYILNSFPWHFNRITLVDEFKEVIYDQQANPQTVKRELSELNTEYFTKLLQQRGDISEARIKEISEQMESDRLEVLQIVEKAANEEKSTSLRGKVEEYLRSTGKEELNPEGIQQDFAKLLEDPEAGLENLGDRLKEFDRDTFVQLLQQRSDITSDEANNIIDQLVSTRDKIVNQAKELQEQANSQAQELRQKVEEYLRNTNKEELNPEGIKRDFSVLLQDPQTGLNLLGSRLSQFDRNTLVSLLSARQDLSEEQLNQILDNLEGVRNNILEAPQKVVDQAKEQYSQTTNAISEYLRNTNLEELNPEGIKRDINKLFENPQEGVNALRDRLSQVDRETLVKLLSQRKDLSEEQVNEIIDSVQDNIAQILRAPRKLAKRATKQVVEFQGSLENYLRNTQKEELNPDGIKRDLQLLLSSPRAGIGSLTERVSQFDRETIVSLLQQREDISPEEANRIVDQIESVRNSVIEQFQQIQQRVQSAVDGTFGSIRNYLNSLNVEELNYEGLQGDFAKLFDSPQEGVDALRQRLGEFDRDTLIAVLSSRSDISPEQANRIVERIEAARDSVIYRAERIQDEVNKRLKAVKQQTQKAQLETQKTVATAAWWLFGTAVTSLAASALAGVYAVKGLPFIN